MILSDKSISYLERFRVNFDNDSFSMLSKTKGCVEVSVFFNKIEELVKFGFQPDAGYNMVLFELKQMKERFLVVATKEEPYIDMKFDIEQMNVNIQNINEIFLSVTTSDRYSIEKDLSIVKSFIYKLENLQNVNSFFNDSDLEKIPELLLKLKELEKGIEVFLGKACIDKSTYNKIESVFRKLNIDLNSTRDVETLEKLNRNYSTLVEKLVVCIELFERTSFEFKEQCGLTIQNIQNIPRIAKYGRSLLFQLKNEPANLSCPTDNAVRCDLNPKRHWGKIGSNNNKGVTKFTEIERVTRRYDLLKNESPVKKVFEEVETIKREWGEDVNIVINTIGEFTDKIWRYDLTVDIVLHRKRKIEDVYETKSKIRKLLVNNRDKIEAFYNRPHFKN